MSQPVSFTTEETTARDTIRHHWITALALVAAAFLVFIGIASFLTSDPEYQDEDRMAGVIAALGAAALLGGLWGLRTGHLKLWIAHTLIVAGALATALFFWLFFIPTIVGLVVIYAGVIKGGLKRELHPD
jgi:hypothetical protein